MTVDWNAFTPLSALAGGVLIGVAAAMLVLLNGRVAGVSSIVGGLLRPVRGELGWQVAFIAGLVAAPGIWRMIAGLPELQIDAGFGALIVAGLLFGISLIVSGLANPAKVLGFLDIAGSWDPSLAFVMVGAIGVAAVGFRMAGRRAQSLLQQPMRLPDARAVDGRLVGGSLLFGIGWGIAGICPGPAVVALGMGYLKAALFVAAMIAGMAVFEFIERRRAARGSADPMAGSADRRTIEANRGIGDG